MEAHIQNFILLTFVLMSFFASVVVFAESDGRASSIAELERRIDEVNSRLGRVSGLTMNKRANRKEVRAVFNEAWTLYTEIANNPNIPDDAEDRLFLRIKKQIEDDAQKIMAHFGADLDTSRLDDYKKAQGIARAGLWIWGRLFMVMASGGMTLKSMFVPVNSDGGFSFPMGTPVFGEYSKLKRLMYGILKDARQHMRVIKTNGSLTPEMRAQAKDAMTSAIDVFTQTEPVRMGPLVNITNLALAIGAIWMGSNPVEAVSERTEWGPAIYGTFYLISGLYIAHRNSVNMGLSTFSLIQDLRWMAGLPYKGVGFRIGTWTRRARVAVTDRIQNQCSRLVARLPFGKPSNGHHGN